MVPPCLGGDQAGVVIVAVFPNLASTGVGSFVHLNLVAAIHLEEGEIRNISDPSRSNEISTHVKGDDADLDGISVFHPDHPLALVIVESIESTRVSVDVASATVVRRSVAVVPVQQFCSNYKYPKNIIQLTCTAAS